MSEWWLQFRGRYRGFSAVVMSRSGKMNVEERLRTVEFATMKLKISEDFKPQGSVCAPKPVAEL